MNFNTVDSKNYDCSLCCIICSLKFISCRTTGRFVIERCSISSFMRSKIEPLMRFSGELSGALMGDGLCF